MFKEPIYDEEKAMNNIYLLLTNEEENIDIAIDNVLEHNKESYIYYPFDPNDYTEEDINKVLKYFSDNNEFEKCIKLMECCSIKTKN
jgi:hypothetical protein